MSALTRRTLVGGGITAGAGIALHGGRRVWADAATPVAASAPPLDPTTIPRYVESLVIPPAMPQTARERRPADLPAEIDYYEIAVRQFPQAILPARLGLQTTVWGYGAIDFPDSFNFPALTIEATVDRPVRVTWINDLVDTNGDYLPHILPVDPTLHWANPGGGVTARDQRPRFR
jgi:spore coat protein A